MLIIILDVTLKDKISNEEVRSRVMATSEVVQESVISRMK